MSTYVFEKPLIRGTMLKRKSQFTALVDIAGEELIAHIPTTSRIGDVENKNLPCLLSYHDDPKRKLKYDMRMNRPVRIGMTASEWRNKNA